MSDPKVFGIDQYAVWTHDLNGPINPLGSLASSEDESMKIVVTYADHVEALRQASARSSTRSVRSEEAAMSEHLPECPMADPSPARRSHCLCDRLRQAEQRGYDKGRYHGWAVNAECCGSCPGECEQRLALAAIKGDSDD